MKKIILLLVLFGFIVGCNNDKKIKEERKLDIKKELNVNKIKIKIITFVPHKVLDAVVNSTKKSLIEKYNISKENIQVFNPNGNIDEIRTFVRTLNKNNTDLIISVSTPTTQAVLSSRHPSIPLVFSFVSDTASLNLSNFKNVTGISNVLNYAKGFELLKDILPNLSKICVVYNPSEPNSNYSYNQIVKYAKRQKPPVNVVARQFSKPDEISIVSSTVSDIDAFYVGGDNKLVNNIKLLLNTADLKRIPVFASDEGSVKEGAIGAYSIDYKKFGIKTSDLVIDVLNNNKSCNGIKIIMYDKGNRNINKSALKKLNIDTDSLLNYKIIE